MANWISHMIIVDKLYSLGIDLNERGFAVGNIAPDCNLENKDWTEFIPSRETMHWMTGNSKLTADYEGFFNKYVMRKRFQSDEHKAFLLGYYSHLVTDVEFQKFVRDNNRVKSIFYRIKQNEDMYSQIKNTGEDFDVLKKVFGRKRIGRDIIVQEINYLQNNPESRYTTVIKVIQDFPDYIDYLPKGSIIRKIKIMANEDLSISGMDELIFYTQSEFSSFIENTSNLIYKLIQEKLRDL